MIGVISNSVVLNEVNADITSVNMKLANMVRWYTLQALYSS